MAKRKEPKNPEAAEAEQIASLMQLLVPFLQRATDVRDYLKKHDRQMRDRAVIALERIADALESRH